jgi:hypothetical protein
MKAVVALSIPMVLGLLASLLHAQAPLHDSDLPGVKPEALQQLSDNRIRQHIIRESQAPYGGRCVCQYQTKNANGHSCAADTKLCTPSRSAILAKSPATW